MKQTILVSALLTGSVGCGHVEGETTLSQEHEEIFGAIMDREPEMTRMAIGMAKSMDTGAIDSSGQETAGTVLAENIAETSRWLWDEYTGGRIYEVDPKSFATSDTIAQYDSESGIEHGDDRIVLDASNPAGWNMAVIAHEAGHKIFWHDLFVTQAIRDAGSVLNEGYARAVTEHRDYAYLLTALYMVPSELTRRASEEIAESRGLAEQIARTDGAVAAADWLRTEISMPSKEEMLGRVDDMYASFSGCYSAFGISNEEARESYLESGLHEALAEWREGEIEAFQKEHSEERTAERRIR